MSQLQRRKLPLRHLIIVLLSSFTITVLGPSGLEASAQAASPGRIAGPAPRGVSGKKKRARPRPNKSPRTEDVKLKKDKDKNRGFEL